MIKQFRNLSFVNLFLLFALILVLRLGLFFNMPTAINSGFTEVFSRLLIPINPDDYLSATSNILIATLVLYVQALIFNHIINKHGIVGRPSFVPAASYIIVCSVFTPFLSFTSPLLCNFFLLFIFNKILSEYKKSNSTATMFDLGLVIALGTIFYFPFSAFLILLWVSLLLMKPFYWREWIGGIVGFLTFMFILGVYYFWNDRLLDFFEIWRPLSAKLPIYIYAKLKDYLVLFPLGVCVLMSAYYLRENFYKSYILVRKSFQLAGFILLIAILSFYLKPGFRINHFLLCAIPAALSISYYFINAKRKWFYETLFLSTIVVILYFQFI